MNSTERNRFLGPQAEGLFLELKSPRTFRSLLSENPYSQFARNFENFPSFQKFFGNIRKGNFWNTEICRVAEAKKIMFISP
jgi:hypothetical protein